MKGTAILIAMLALAQLAPAQQKSVYESEHFIDRYGERVFPPPFDFDQDLKSKSLEELRYLRNELYARKGHLFKDAVLRAWFQQYEWYQPIWWVPGFTVTLNEKEEGFVKKVKDLEKSRASENFLRERGGSRINLKNLVNTRQFERISDTLFRKLEENGFAIVPGDHLQLLDLYEENDYNLLPSFVTTDLYLQLMHMYFSFTTRKLEEKKLADALKRLLAGLHKKVSELASSESDAGVKQHASWLQAWCAVPLRLLGTKPDPAVPPAFAKSIKEELSKIAAAELRGSAFLEAPLFDYTQFRPRGHYTRSKALERYFRAMMWLQTAGFPLDKQEFTARAALLAHCVTAGGADGKTPNETLFRAVSEPLDFLVGEPDNISLSLCVARLRKDLPDASPAVLIEPKNLTALSASLKAAEPERIKARAGMKENVAELKRPRLFFFPQRYTPDAEILQRLVHVLRDPVPKRPFPKGLDIFAAFGNPTAERILLKEYRETEAWADYDDSLRAVARDMAGYDAWDGTVYAKWLRSLTGLREVPEGCQPFMKTDAWQRKCLNTALASWTELKHDVVLYAKQPMAAECGGDSPPPQPVTVGYVEPNTAFWKAAVDMLANTKTFLERHSLMTPEIEAKTANLIEMGEFLLRTSSKQLRNERLSEKEYETIRLIGASASGITLSILDSPDWISVTGPDRSVALATDVYTYDTECLQEAVGKVNEIFVAVEIDGLPYLTRGAVFSYYEFLHPAADRLTDERWQEMLEAGQAPGVPLWVEPIIAPVKPMDVAPASSYSSGC